MENRNEGKAIASLVLGIISLVFVFFGTFAFIGMILAIIGLILGISAKKENPEDGKAKAGVVLSIISLALCTLSLIACAICFSSLASLSMF
ncbi:MAG: DUF4190 domain-containing protein [Clostridiales bacterium]|nr:DUF4190 domain-containing protein [Clostridiales bacterium]